VIRSTKFRVGNILLPVQLDYIDEKLINLHFPFNRDLLEIVKSSFEGRKWLGPPINPNGPKLWQIPVTQRNNFVLDYLEMRNPYKKFDDAIKPEKIAEYIDKVKEYEVKRFGKLQLFSHQRELIAHALMTKTCIYAAEMGVGKTLAAFIFLEMSQAENVFWVAPNSAIRAYYEEVRKWKPNIDPHVMTYTGLKGIVDHLNEPPDCIIFDESPKIKTYTSQRSVAARNLTNDMRLWFDNPTILLMSGAPAPKSPLDWWHQCEVCCPGYLSEANIFIFREKLDVFVDAENGDYKKHIMWKDDSSKCMYCYELKDHPNHDVRANPVDNHKFHPMVDEVSKLNSRLKGLVIFKLKKDCLDLPDKIYDRRILKPTAEIIQAARLITKSSTRVIEALTKLRMLSDGFQYTETKSGETVCPLCMARGEYEEYYDPEEPDSYIPDEWVSQGIKYVFDDEGTILEEKQIVYSKRTAVCPNCTGSGRVNTYTRTVDRVPCPKDDELLADLDAHEESGRLNVYAGFTASVDRVVEKSLQAGWSVIRADGRGWFGQTPYGEILDNDRLLEYYQEAFDRYPKMVFVGQPGAAGEGLTLTAAHSTVFWSNDFNGNSRMQAEDRGHRPGMDKEKGGRIVDYIHLESDMYVLKNLKQKKELMKQTMTGLREAMGVS